MNKVILLVLNDAHAKALGDFTPAIKSLSPKHVWLIFSPHIGVTDEAAISQIDQEIESWKKSMNDASARLDFDAAKEFKDGWEQRRMNREATLRNGWTAVDAAKRDEMYRSVFDKFIRDVACEFTITTLQNAEDPENPFGILRELSSAWPGEFRHGEYLLTWPTGLNVSNWATVSGPEEPRPESQWHRDVKRAKELGVFEAGMNKAQLAAALQKAGAAAAA